MSRAAKLTALALLVLGISDVVLRCYLLGSLNALTLALQDPAKTLFHLMQLPLAAFVLLRDYPINIIRACVRTQKTICLGIGVLLLSLAIIFGITDTIAGFSQRWPMPEDIKDAQLRGELLNLRLDFLRGDSDPKRLYEDYNRKIGLQNRSMAAASSRVYVSGLLSTLGIIFAVLLLWTLVVHAISRKPLSEEFVGALIFVVSILSPWLLLRPYSEWHLHFGEGDLITYKPLFIASVFSLIVIFLIVILKQRRKLGALIAVGVSVGTTLLAILAAVRKDWFSQVAWVAARSDLLYTTIFYVLIGCFVLAILTFSGGAGARNVEEGNGVL
jgi:hypothetical protein